MVHHVNDIGKVGPVTSSPSRWLDLSASLLVETLGAVDNFAQPVFKLTCIWTPLPYVHPTSLM